jgi:hypothetical protein
MVFCETVKKEWFTQSRGARREVVMTTFIHMSSPRARRLCVNRLPEAKSACSKSGNGPCDPVLGTHKKTADPVSGIGGF